jgi:hypothetical protein
MLPSSSTLSEEGFMRVMEVERIGERRVRLVVTPDGAYAITIETLGPDDAWVDISLLADARLRSAEAERRYRQRVREMRSRRKLASAFVER